MTRSKASWFSRAKTRPLPFTVLGSAPCSMKNLTFKKRAMSGLISTAHNLSRTYSSALQPESLPLP
jgi:hypothetical protein